MRPYSPGGALNAFASAPTELVASPTPSAHRLHPGLPGYLIPLAPLGFVPHRRIRPSKSPSPPVVRWGLQDFTPTLNVPFASSGPKSRSIPSKFGLKTRPFTKDLHGRLRTLRPNNHPDHSGSWLYRGGWHQPCPPLIPREHYAREKLPAKEALGIPLSPFRAFRVFAPAAPRRAWPLVSVAISRHTLSCPVRIKG